MFHCNILGRLGDPLDQSKISFSYAKQPNNIKKQTINYLQKKGLFKTRQNLKTRENFTLVCKHRISHEKLDEIEEIRMAWLLSCLQLTHELNDVLDI